MPSDAKYVAVAEIARPHGVGGELKLKVYNIESDLLLDRPPLRLRFEDGRTQDAQLSRIRRVPGAMLATLRGVEGRDAAEALRCVQIEVARSLLGDADQGEYFICDLIGCDAYLGEESLGVVERVQNYPTCDALVLMRPGKPRLEVPLVERHVGEVDVVAKRIEVLTLEGLS